MKSVSLTVGQSVYWSVRRLVVRSVGWDNGPYCRSAPTIHLTPTTTSHHINHALSATTSNEEYAESRLVGWSVGRLVGWSVGRLVGLSVSLTVGRSAGRLGRWSLSSISPDDPSGDEEYAESRSVGWSVGRSIGQSDGWSVGRLVGTMVPIVDRP
jgi:hypothetical protein